jgi:3-mercaptopyruvate sulfurtransferase SseA
MVGAKELSQVMPGLAACTDADVYILDGGIEAWKAAGYPVSRG